MMCYDDDDDDGRDHNYDGVHDHNDDDGHDRNDDDADIDDVSNSLTCFSYSLKSIEICCRILLL